MASYDLIVVGGGVNGVGIARDAAQRGLSVALFEQGDLGAGTSGASSGLIHGGIRYLETDRDVTRTSCQDSGYIQAIAPHLLFRVPLMFPILKHSVPRPRLLLEMAYAYFQAYDAFQPLKRGKPSAKLTAEEALLAEPGLNPELVGAVTTDEWGINVFRLCALNALEAKALGAHIFLGHRVERFLRAADGRVLGVAAVELATGRRVEVQGRATVNATGPWSEAVAAKAGATVKIRPGKGIHLVFDRCVVNYGVLATAVDGRQVFVEPYGQEAWIGTTDDDYYGDPGEVQATHDEVLYLLQAIESVYPKIRQYRLVRAFAGVRPTLYAYGPSEDALSRAHRVFDHAGEGAPGLFSLAGGKLAAYREMSQHLMDVVAPTLGNHTPCRTHKTPLPGGESTPTPADLPELEPYPAARLIHRQGARALEVTERIKRRPVERRLLCQCEPVTEAEVRFVIENEWVSSLEDLRRRTHCGGGACQGARCARRAATVLAEAKGGGPDLAERLLTDFVRARWREQAPVLSGNTRPQLELGRYAYRASEGEKP